MFRTKAKSVGGIGRRVPLRYHVWLDASPDDGLPRHHLASFESHEQARYFVKALLARADPNLEPIPTVRPNFGRIRVRKWSTSNPATTSLFITWTGP